MSNTHHGLIVIADITGYSVYLSESELDHARDTLETLLEILVDHTRPPLIISRLAGDAVISYAVDERLPRGQTFVEMIEDTYVAFRKAIELMILNNTCQCNACANVSSLDLKFFVHCGSFALQHIDQHHELVGSDVNLIHRLLKNQVKEKSGIRAYTLYTQTAINDLELEAIVEGMPIHVETYEHFGDVETRVQDMHTIWEKKRDSKQIVFAERDVGFEMVGQTSAPPHLAWEYVISPEYRNVLFGSDQQNIINRSGGRVTRGSAYQCFHGDQMTLQTILEYQPFERMVTEDQGMMGLRFLAEYRLSPSPEGSQITIRMSRPRGPALPRLLFNLLVGRMISGHLKERFNVFIDQVEADLAARGGPEMPEPSTSQDQIRAAATASLPAPSS